MTTAVVAAVAALAGVVLGNVLDRNAEGRKWRRQTRLDIYLDATAAFERLQRSSATPEEDRLRASDAAHKLMLVAPKQLLPILSELVAVIPLTDDEAKLAVYGERYVVLLEACRRSLGMHQDDSRINSWIYRRYTRRWVAERRSDA